MRNIAIGALASFLLVGVVGCQPATKDDMERIEAKMDEVLKRVAGLEGKLAGAAPAARRGPPPEDFSKVHQINLSGAPVFGNPNAPITVVEFSDFECPYCARTSPDVMALQEKYPDKVRVVYKHFPLGFHKSARPTAIASVAAQEQGKFWEYHDVLFGATSKRQLSGADEDLAGYAEEAGLDVARFKRDYEQNKEAYGKRVDDDYAHGVSAQVKGTPSLYINGKKVQDRSVQGMSRVVDQLLAEM